MALIPGLPPLILTNTMIQGYHHDEEKMGDAQVSVVQVQVFGKGVRPGFLWAGYCLIFVRLWCLSTMMVLIFHSNPKGTTPNNGEWR